METVTIDTLRDEASALAAEVKSLERRARWAKQQSAALRDNIDHLQPIKEAQDEYHRNEADK